MMTSPKARVIQLSEFLQPCSACWPHRLYLHDRTDRTASSFARCKFLSMHFATRHETAARGGGGFEFFEPIHVGSHRSHSHVPREHCHV